MKYAPEYEKSPCHDGGLSGIVSYGLRFRRTGDRDGASGGEPVLFHAAGKIVPVRTAFEVSIFFAVGIIFLSGGVG